jgi:hypothetical protein
MEAHQRKVVWFPAAMFCCVKVARKLLLLQEELLQTKPVPSTELKKCTIPKQTLP